MLALVACFGITAANAQSKPAKKAAPAKTEAAPKAVDGPGIQFDAEVIDYGTISRNADGKRDFVFTNNGTKPLIITNATGSCGCTVPTKPTEPIMPGQKGVIGVKYDTNRVGPFSKTVTVTTNASETAKTLTIKGNVVDDTKAAPQKS